MTIPKRIAVVDDNALNARLFSDIAEAAGFAPVVYRGPWEEAAAVEWLRAQDPEALVIDVQLGRNASGLEVARMLGGGVRVVVVTASERGREEAERLGAAYIQKPVDFRAFIRALGGGNG